jgi:hypothetical protein
MEVVLCLKGPIEPKCIKVYGSLGVRAIGIRRIHRNAPSESGGFDGIMGLPRKYCTYRYYEQT